jgi:hypothetical protein
MQMRCIGRGYAANDEVNLANGRGNGGKTTIKHGHRRNVMKRH